VLLSKVKNYKVGSAFDDNPSAPNPLEVINTDVTYSGFNLLYTQLGDLMGPFFLFIVEDKSFSEFPPIFAVL
jgi:hypothetical protein